MNKPASFSGSRTIGWRTLMRGAGAGFCFTALPMLDLLTRPADASTWRGFVGCLAPRAHDSSLAEMVKLLPDRHCGRLSEPDRGHTGGIAEQLRHV